MGNFFTNSEYTMIGHYVRPNWKMLWQTLILVEKCPISDRYFKHCLNVSDLVLSLHCGNTHNDVPYNITAKFIMCYKLLNLSLNFALIWLSWCCLDTYNCQNIWDACIPTFYISTCSSKTFSYWCNLCGTDCLLKISELNKCSGDHIAWLTSVYIYRTKKKLLSHIHSLILKSTIFVVKAWMRWGTFHSWVLWSIFFTFRRQYRDVPSYKIAVATKRRIKSKIFRSKCVGKWMCSVWWVVVVAIFGWVVAILSDSPDHYRHVPDSMSTL